MNVSVRTWILAALASVAVVCPAQERVEERGRTAKIRIGGKNFTESNVLGEIVAQLLEARTDLVVERALNLGGTMVCFGALQSGDIDCYCDYTGTAWSIILKVISSVLLQRDWFA